MSGVDGQQTYIGQHGGPERVERVKGDELQAETL